MMKNFLLLLLSSLFVLSIHSCKKEEPCTLTCQNNGIVTIDCTCACPSGFEGPQCETESCLTVCQNGGDLTAQCVCDCPAGFTGTYCETCVPQLGVYVGNSYWVPSGTNHPNHFEITLPSKHVMTGIGFGDNSTFMVAGREVLSNGTLGPEYQSRDGSNPNGTLDVSHIVPEGHIITGVGYGISSLTGDFRRLLINYSEITFDSDCNMILAPPQLYDNNDPVAIDVWLKIADLGLNTEDTGIRSIGISYGNQQVEIVSGRIF